MKLKDINSFTRGANYRTNVSLDHLEWAIENYVKDYNLDLDPDFQRAHVWSEMQQIRYLEYLFRGGTYSREILFNMPQWGSGENNIGNMVLVDGKQRLQAIRRFLKNELPIFGTTLLGWEDHKIALKRIDMIFCVNNLMTRQEVLQWYLDLNAGGTVHTTAELLHVSKLLLDEKKKNKA